jgi:hypothetical protein
MLKAKKKVIFLHQRGIAMRKRCLFIFLLAFLAVCAFAQPVTITPPSANIQPGESVMLTASGATYYRWAPATGLSTTEGPVVVASPTVTTTYTCSGYAPGAESVVNGNFDQGNVGFTSAYQYNNNLFGEGTYYVDSDASLHHENFVGHGHGGTGNFMIVNGATSPGINVWTEQITVVPNTYYAFSTWVCTLAGTADQVALLQFSINDTQIGNIFSAPPQLNTWQQFYELWYSGSSTSATITILNQNTVVAGNDFGLDDISFCEIVLVGAPECTVYVGSMSATATADNAELCDGESTTLHALPVNGSGNYTYSWAPANTLDNPSSQHPVATPVLGITTYTCQINDVGWNNTENVSVTIEVHPNEEEHVSHTICANETYEFYDTIVSEPGQYVHHMETQYGCDHAIFLHLDNWPLNDTIIVDTSICVGQTYNFHGTEYDHDGQIAYFDTTDDHGCLMVEKLILSVGEYQIQPVQEEYVCYSHDEEPFFKWDKNGKEYHNDTIDEAILPDLVGGGCDFKYQLNLKFHEEFYNVNSVDTCNAYYWPITGLTYDSTQTITETFQHQIGNNRYCDSTYVLNLEISNYSPSPTEIKPESTNHSPHWVVTATEFQINSYDFSISEKGKAKWTEPVEWQFVKKLNDDEWVEDTSIQWILEIDTTTTPPGKRCRIYVLNYIPDTIWLAATAYNECAPEGITKHYWFVCSFYDVEEMESRLADFDVIPNPNDGQMTLVFDRFEGNVEVKVYDVMGNLIDDFETYNDMESKVLEYNLCRAKGIYFFVAIGKEGTIAKKVVIR